MTTFFLCSFPILSFCVVGFVVFLWKGCKGIFSYLDLGWCGVCMSLCVWTDWWMLLKRTMTRYYWSSRNEYGGGTFERLTCLLEIGESEMWWLEEHKTMNQEHKIVQHKFNLDSAESCKNQWNFYTPWVEILVGYGWRMVKKQIPQKQQLISSLLLK